MPKDLHDLTLTTERAETVAAFNTYATDWIGHGPRVRSIFEAADADPHCALVNAHAAAVHMALEAAPGFKTARTYLRRARKTAREGTAREQAFIAAIADWWRGNTAGTLKRLRKIVDENPADIVAAKWAQYHAFNMGDARAMRDIAETVLPVHASASEAWAMAAFAHDQCCDEERAEGAVERALHLNPADPWAHHAMAHIMDGQGRTDEAITFLTEKSIGWSNRSVFVREHNFWHLAIFHLDRGETARALEIFDKHLWGEWREFAQEQLGAISALWRMELRGVDVGRRWDPVVAKVVERWHEHILPFHDVHFAYALARGDRTNELREFMASLSRHGAKDTTGVWESLVIPCARGLIAHAERRYADAATLIAPLLPRLHLIGGSTIQRDAITQTLADANRRAELVGRLAA